MVPLTEEHLGFLPIWGREKQNVLGIAFDVKRKFSDLSRKKIEHQLAIRGGRYEDTPLGGTQPFRTDPADLMRDRRVWGCAQSLVAGVPPPFPQTPSATPGSSGLSLCHLPR